MANILGDDKRQQILALGRLGWPLRRIEEATGVRRETASGYLKAAGIAIRAPRRRRPPPKPASEVCRAETSIDRMRSVHAGPNLAKSLIVVARKALRPLQQTRLCCKDSFHSTDLLAVSERAAEVNLHASGRKPRLRRSSTTGFV